MRDAYRTAYTLHIPDPTWGNHFSVFQDAGLRTKSYRYYDPATRGLNFKGLLDDVKVCSTHSPLMLLA